MIIAIDGPAASGKGTLARRLAEAYRLPHLDTGLLYRAVARHLLDRGVPLLDRGQAALVAGGLDTTALDDPRLRERVMGEAASMVSGYPEVRAALVERQRAFAGQPGGAVLDGRDIGTVICPLADVKLFVTAAPEERARRRTLELQAKGEAADYGAILAEIRQRDARDAGRDASPLCAAPDALRLDTTALDAEGAFRAARDLVEAALREACGQR